MEEMSAHDSAVLWSKWDETPQTIFPAEYAAEIVTAWDKALEEAGLADVGNDLLASFSQQTDEFARADSTVHGMNQDEVISLARSMGLEVKAPKRIFIKHSYSITAETKEKFQTVCRSLGIKMQDGMEEAMGLFFEKHGEKFAAVKRVKSL